MGISLNDVQRGYDAWAAKPHNEKWVRKIDGTPIANDIVVNIFEALKDVEPAPQMSVQAEPFGAVTYDLTGCEHFSRDVALIEKIASAGSNGPTEVIYVYADSPPQTREVDHD